VVVDQQYIWLARRSAYHHEGIHQWRASWRDPEGFLFFNDVGDLDGDMVYDVYYNKVDDSKQRAFVIQFYHKNQTSNKSLAKFLAKDPNNTVQYTIDAAPGNWRTLTSGSSMAHVKKNSTETEWTVTVPSIHMKASFSDTSTTNANQHKRVDVWGPLTFTDIDKIQKGVYVDYRDDRIVFTETQWNSTDFCAYFIPVETLQVSNPLGPYVVQGVKVTWSKDA